jgi:hypothetical protein
LTSNFSNGRLCSNFLEDLFQQEKYLLTLEEIGDDDEEGEGGYEGPPSSPPPSPFTEYSPITIF